jgi:hypothetical protein
MSGTIRAESATAVWVTIDKRIGWTKPQRLTQKLESQSFGTPSDPADAGRAAVDQHREDLRQLAGS